MENQSDLVETFVLGTLPKNYLDALRMLAKLTFPMPDRKTFVERVDNESSQLNESGKTTAALLKQSFGGLDFPIESTQSAMEKFHTRRLWTFDQGSAHTLGGFWLEAFLHERRVAYINLFGIECGLEAFDILEGVALKTVDMLRILRTDAECMGIAMSCLRSRGDRLPPWWRTELRPGGA
jgi:hypothetical protein